MNTELMAVYFYERKDVYGNTQRFVTPNEDLAFARSNTGRITKQLNLAPHENN
jgi:hypothetical protein